MPCIHMQAKASGASAANIAWGLYLLSGPSGDSSIFNMTSPFGAANSVFGASAQNLKQAAGRCSAEVLTCVMLQWL